MGKGEKESSDGTERVEFQAGAGKGSGACPGGASDNDEDDSGGDDPPACDIVYIILRLESWRLGIDGGGVFCSSRVEYR